MGQLDFGIKLPKPVDLYGLNKPKKKRVTLTSKQRIYVWEHPEMYGRKCSICSGRITKLSDLELDHTRPYSQGGSKMNLAHRDCNRMKGTKSLSHVQTKMGFKKTVTRKPTKKRRKRRTNEFGLEIKPIKFKPFRL